MDDRPEFLANGRVSALRNGLLLEIQAHFVGAPQPVTGVDLGPWRISVRKMSSQWRCSEFLMESHR
jgi:hypothetical protein